MKFKVRIEGREKGVHIDTVREKHGGEFAGYHGRYILRSACAVERY